MVRRRLERKMNKTGKLEDKLAYKAQCQFVNFLLNEAKQEFYSKKILFSLDDKRKVFTFTKQILNWSQDPQLPSGLRNIPTHFCDFFIHKIVNIHEDLVTKQCCLEALDSLRMETNQLSADPLDSFTPATKEEVRRVILNSSNATSDSDPIPTHIGKHCVDSLITPVTDIVNHSLKNGSFPHQYKKL